MKKVSYLTGDDILSIHDEVVKIFAESGDPVVPSGPKHLNLVYSAATRPQTSLFDVDKYTTINQKAAALFHSLITNHAFHNGNKRTALVSLLVFLHSNDHRILIEDDSLFDFVIAVADNQIEKQTESGHPDEVIAEITKWLSKYTTKIDHKAKSMRINDFIDKCEVAGASVRTNKGGSHLIFGQNRKSITISGSTSEIDGAIVKRYIQKLGLSQSSTGATIDEFTEGLKPQQTLIRQYRSVLDRLAYT